MAVLEPLLILFLKNFVPLFCVDGAGSSSLRAGLSLVVASRLLWPWAHGPRGCGARALGSSGPGRTAPVGVEHGLWAPLALGARPPWVWSRGFRLLWSWAPCPHGCGAGASLFCSTWGLPGPGIKLASVALEGRLPSTVFLFILNFLLKFIYLYFFTWLLWILVVALRMFSL